MSYYNFMLFIVSIVLLGVVYLTRPVDIEDDKSLPASAMPKEESAHLPFTAIQTSEAPL